MSSADIPQGTGAPAPEKRLGLVRRAWQFVLDLIDVLLKPSSIFGLGWYSPASSPA